MAKKVKCLECANMMHWATPLSINAKNYEYAKHCLDAVKRSFVCGMTSKVKPIGNEQYCKYFEKCVYKQSNELEAKRLEKLIAEYEDKLAETKGE